MEETTDSALVAQARSGDKHAFSQLTERYQWLVKRIAMGMVSNAEIARELAQEAILQTYLSLDQLRDNARFKSWLYGITLNVCRTYMREQKADFVSLESLSGGAWHNVPGLLDSVDVVDPQAIAEERELHALVLYAIQHLSPKERATTLMFYYEQLTLEEIVTILGISVVAVKGRLYRARKQLRERLASSYPEMQQANSTTQRRRAMVRARINSIRINEASQQRIVILQDEAGQHVLPIWVGKPEARVLAAGLFKLDSPRPMSIHLLINLLKAAKMEIEEVRIEALKDEIFYATVKIRNGNTTFELDARPSDALTLAVYLDAPIYIAEEVMKQVGMPLPEGQTLYAPTNDAQYREEFLRNLAEEDKAVLAQMERWQSMTEEERVEEKRKLIASFLEETLKEGRHRSTEGSTHQ